MNHSSSQDSDQFLQKVTVLANSHFSNHSTSAMRTYLRVPHTIFVNFVDRVKFIHTSNYVAIIFPRSLLYKHKVIKNTYYIIGI